jgi:hypothetical protein
LLPPTSLKGYAHIPRDVLSAMPHQAKGPVTALSAKPSQGTYLRWTFAVEDQGKSHTFVVELPAGLPLPIAQGDTIHIQTQRSGGGPNVVGHLFATDANGGLLLAINSTPPGWLIDFGRARATDKGEPYDSTDYDTSIRPPQGKKVEITSGWSQVALAGARYYGIASAVRRTLHKGKLAPPDFVGSWIDYSLVRVATGAGI